MIQKALEYLVGLGNTRIEKVDNQIYSTQRLHTVAQAIVSSVNVRSLSGFVEYLKSDFDLAGKLMVHVMSPTEVIAFSGFNRDLQRNVFIKATAMIPSFRFDNFYDTESFNIKLQSTFCNNEDKEIMLKIVGSIKEDAVKTVGDDGVSQSVVAKTGVATVENVRVPNPVVLKPYRTFVEVNQPESNFIFRMQSGPKCALFEADGGAWELAAMENIREYLEDKLSKEIVDDKLVIIA